MRLVFYGTSQFAVPALEALVAAGHQIPLVVTQPNRPAGRGRRLSSPPVKQAAQRLGLIVCQPPSPNDPASLERVADARPDLLVVVAYGHLLREPLLDTPRLGSINLHASLLPRYRGAAPIHHAIIAGEGETGLTTIWMTPELDAGDIILQRRLPISPHDTVGTLSERLARSGATLLVETLEQVATGTAPRIPQDESQATYAPALTRVDARINWSRPARDLQNFVRGTNPRPGAFTTHRGRLLKVWQTREAKNQPGRVGKPGEIVEIAHDGIVVQTGEGRLCLTQVQPESRRTMSGAEYLRGRQVDVGEMLG